MANDPYTKTEATQDVLAINWHNQRVLKLDLNFLLFLINMHIPHCNHLNHPNKGLRRDIALKMMCPYLILPQSH